MPLYETYLTIKQAAFDPPMSLEAIKSKYGDTLYNQLSKDPIHKWRAENGIELLHEEPTEEEFKRILANWNLMNSAQKQLSDEQSIRLFGKNNLDRVADIKKLYKARKFVETVRQMARRRKLNVFVLTDGASGVSNNGNPAIRNARNAQIQWELENGYDPYEDWGTKQASRLYTYVDPEADLSKGLLSARLAPEDILMRRYRGHDYATSKENILKFFKEHNDKGRVDSIYALDTPIPDNANEQLLKFRNARKLVSFDAEDIKDLVRILRRRTGKPPIEVTPDFEPRKHVQWGRDPSKVMKNPGRGPFHYAPAYKILTESGRIPPELLTYE